MDRTDFAAYARSVAADGLVAAVQAACEAQGIPPADALEYAAKVKLMADEAAVANQVGRKLTRAERQAAHVRLLRGQAPAAIAQGITSSS